MRSAVSITYLRLWEYINTHGIYSRRYLILLWHKKTLVVSLPNSRDESNFIIMISSF